MDTKFSCTVEAFRLDEETLGANSGLCLRFLWALSRENWYRPEKLKKVPGEEAFSQAPEVPSWKYAA